MLNFFKGLTTFQKALALFILLPFVASMVLATDLPVAFGLPLLILIGVAWLGSLLKLIGIIFPGW